MSILIKGMDMPKNGEITIAFASDENGKNTLALILDNKSGKVIEHKCVVEIPTPHGRLIDADALPLRDIDVANYPSNYIKNAPTIIEAEG